MKFDNKDIDYWFSADFHGYHKNICKGVSRWNDKSGCRDFKDHIEMTNHIINQINKNVMPDDILFFLGDFVFGGIDNIWNFRKRINCKNIYLCIGNHDKWIKKNAILPNCRFGNPDSQKEKLDLGYLIEDSDESDVVQGRDLFSDVQLMYEIQIHGHRMTLCHYSMRTWYYHNKGSFMLFGHSHDSLHPEGKTMDVGVDTAKRLLGEYRPFKFQEIQKIMSNKEFKQVDSHSKTTNAQ